MATKPNDENISHTANLPSLPDQAGKGTLKPSNGLTAETASNNGSVVISPVSAKNILPTRLRPNRRVHYEFEEKDQSSDPKDDEEEEDPSYIPLRDREEENEEEVGGSLKASTADEIIETEEEESGFVAESTAKESASERFHSEVAFILSQVDERIAAKERVARSSVMTMKSRIETTLSVYGSLFWSAMSSYWTKKKSLPYGVALIVSLVFIFRGFRTLQSARR